MAAKINVIAAVQPQDSKRYKDGLSEEPQFEVSIVSSIEETMDRLDNLGIQTDVCVIDNTLGDVYDVVKDIRQSYPRLIIVLVDEGADFALPGRADDISTDPFTNKDLVTRIKRLNEDRRLQTLRADALPPVRQFAKAILKAEGSVSQQQAAVEAVQQLGYDYVAFYTVTKGDNPELHLAAQIGPDDHQKIAPKNPSYNNSLMGWVAQNGQSRMVTKDDTPNHPFVERERFGHGVCIPVGTTLRFGVLVALKEASSSISSENVMMLELISAQLSSALAKDAR